MSGYDRRLGSVGFCVFVQKGWEEAGQAGAGKGALGALWDARLLAGRLQLLSLLEGASIWCGPAEK